MTQADHSTPQAQIRWRIHLTSPPEKVYQALATEEGRKAFWAVDAPEREGAIQFEFLNGMELESKILHKVEAKLFELEYFGGSQASFALEADGQGGTDLTLTESGVPETHLADHRPGWISVLLALKAAVEHAVDLRNHDPERTWERGYVDV